MSWKLVFTKRAASDVTKLACSGLKERARRLLDVFREDPYRAPPPFEKLQGDLKGCCSRRINVQHRIVYEVLDNARTVKILSAWTHYR